MTTLSVLLIRASLLKPLPNGFFCALPAPCRCLRLASFRGKKRPRKLLISGHYLPVALRLRSLQNAPSALCERFPLGESATRHPLKADGASTAPIASPVAAYLLAFLRDGTIISHLACGEEKSCTFALVY